MNIRDLISNLDAIEAHTTGNPVNAVDSLDAHPVEVEIEPVDNTEVVVMVPPLQASLELLKRATDVPNYYSSEEEQECRDGDYADEESEDELGAIQRLAGTSTAVIFQAADQTPTF